VYVKNLYVHNFNIHTGIRVQSLTKGQIIMDIDFRWGGDPSIILAVEAALVASIPIQVYLAEYFSVEYEYHRVPSIFCQNLIFIAFGFFFS
jgi:hypothetical protein